MKKDLSENEIRQIEKIPLDYKQTREFFHCKHCIEQFMGSELHDIMTPRDYGMYEVGVYDFVYPDGSLAPIVVVWCKRCGRKVWDGRRYERIY
jgi:uncharacterized protein with PIN domain